MLKYLQLMIIGLTLSACGSDYILYDIPQIVTEVKIPDEPGEPSPKLDVLLVLDNSCSMMSDWDYISYGLTQIPEELNDYGFNWNLGITSMDPNDGTFFEVMLGENPGWDMIGGIDDLREEAGGTENGFDGALRARNLNQDFFRNGVTTLIIFVSDEREQSSMTADDFHIAWGIPHITASITGPSESIAGEFPCAEAAPKYHQVSQVVIDICALEQWSIIDQIVE